MALTSKTLYQPSTILDLNSTLFATETVQTTFQTFDSIIQPMISKSLLKPNSCGDHSYVLVADTFDANYDLAV